MKIKKKLSVIMLAFTLVFNMTGCSGSGEASNTSAVEETGAAVTTDSVSAESEPVQEPESQEESTTQEETSVPEKITPEFYEEQPDIPSLESIAAAATKVSRKSLGPAENGKYLEFCYFYRTEADGEDCSEEILSAYTGFLAEQGFIVQEVTSADAYAVLNSSYHQKGYDDDKELYHILSGEDLRAVVAYSEEGHSLAVYLMDVWEEGKRPEAAIVQDTSKETAYKTGTVWLVGQSEEATYEMQFTDGQLVSQSYEDYEGKGGYGGDSSMGIEYSEFYGMTVEEVSKRLEEEGYTITLGDDLYDTLLKSLNH